MYIWQLLGGKMDWQAMPMVFDIYDVEPDHEILWRLQLLSSEMPRL